MLWGFAAAMRFFTAIPAVICFLCCWSLVEAGVAYINSTMNGSEIATTIRTETGCSGASVEVVLNATESPMSAYSASQVKAVLGACLDAAPPSTRLNVSGNDAETQAPVRVGCDDCPEQNITISNSLLSLKGLAFKNCQVQLSGLVSADLSIESCRFASVDCSRGSSAPAIGNSARGVAASLAVSNASRVTLTNCNFSENVITPPFSPLSKTWPWMDVTSRTTISPTHTHCWAKPTALLWTMFTSAVDWFSWQTGAH